MPQPTAHPTRAAIPTQRRSTTAMSRQQAEQDWITLVATWRLLNRIVVERHRHGYDDDADAFAADSAVVEEDLARTFGARWARLRPQLLAELEDWRTEPHHGDPLSCTYCRVQNRPPDERITVPPPRRRWFS